MSSYTELLKSPQWQKKRLEIQNERDWTCERCGAQDKTLHVHHKKYVKGAKPWEYENDNFLVLCEDCHNKIHEDKKAIDKLIDELSEANQKLLRGVLEGLWHFVYKYRKPLVVNSYEDYYKAFVNDALYMMSQHWKEEPRIFALSLIDVCCYLSDESIQKLSKMADELFTKEYELDGKD